MWMPVHACDCFGLTGCLCLPVPVLVPLEHGHGLKAKRVVLSGASQHAGQGDRCDFDGNI